MKNESGRSMVEMLAVLAIMGVLSVTGIVAYNLAMTKHKANEIIHKANMAYMDVMTRDTIENWSELEIAGVDNAFMQGLIYKEAGFVLIENIDKDVCENILKDKTNFSLMTIENESFTTCESKNDMIFDFANAGDIGLKCISGHCPLEDAGQYCSGNTGTCVMKTDCTNERLWSYKTDTCDTCEGVNGDLAPVFKNNDCISCAENDDTKPIWDSSTKKCVNCLADADCETDSYCGNNECTVCPANSGPLKNNNEQIPGMGCYCNSGYKVNDVNNGCDPTMETKCAEGTIITAENGERYCLNNSRFYYTKYASAKAWCVAREMDLVEKDVLCPDKPIKGGVCKNLTETGSAIWVWTSTSCKGSDSSFHYRYIVNLSSGVLSDDNYLPSYYYYALCQ